MSYLKIENGCKSFGSKTVLKNINIEIEEGEFLCLLGPSGCGKTTLLRTIAGLENIDSGSVYLQGREITKLSPEKRGFGIVFQSYALFPNMTAFRNIAFALEQKKMKKEEIIKKVNEVLEVVGLKNDANKYPRELSGGMQQRVAIARALALEPKFLLLDEPMSALDARVRTKLRMDIKRLQKKLKITTIMVTHDQEEAITMADRIAVLNEGNVMQIGTPQEVYEKPENLFTAQFIGDTNCINLDGSIYTVRPEYVHISKEKAIGYEGIIESIEFRGSFVRVSIISKSSRIKETIISDIAVREWIALDLMEEDKVHFSFKDENYRKYEISKGA